MATWRSTARALGLQLFLLCVILVSCCKGWSFSRLLRLKSLRHGHQRRHHPGHRHGIGQHCLVRRQAAINLDDLGFVSVAGQDPDRYKVNQDAFFYSPSSDTDANTAATIVGVLDGHGTKGHVLTSYLKEQLPKRIRQLLCEPESVTEEDQEKLKQLQRDLVRIGGANEQEVTRPLPLLDNNNTTKYGDSYYACILTNAFYLAQLDAQAEPGIPAQRSGTTCVVALVVHDDDDQAGDDDSTARGSCRRLASALEDSRASRRHQRQQY